MGIALHQYLHSRHQQCHAYICPLGIEKKPETATDNVVGDYRRTRNLVSDTYSELGLTLGSGIYGSTFFMLTGFHGMHVTLGTVILFVILLRCIRGHFSPEDHFGFEAASWYWHFVDVVWLLLFTFVYWF